MFTFKTSLNHLKTHILYDSPQVMGCTKCNSRLTGAVISQGKVFTWKTEKADWTELRISYAWARSMDERRLRIHPWETQTLLHHTLMRGLERGKCSDHDTYSRKRGGELQIEPSRLIWLYLMFEVAVSMMCDRQRWYIGEILRVTPIPLT
jgi:hypothetical protein